MLLKLYKVFGGAMVAWYLAGTLFGWELGAGERQTIPDGLRQSPGGYRSFHFWHSGYHGGK